MTAWLCPECFDIMESLRPQTCQICGNCRPLNLEEVLNAETGPCVYWSTVDSKTLKGRTESRRLVDTLSR